MQLPHVKVEYTRFKILNNTWTLKVVHFVIDSLHFYLDVDVCKIPRFTGSRRSDVEVAIRIFGRYTHTRKTRHADCYFSVLFCDANFKKVSKAYKRCRMEEALLLEHESRKQKQAEEEMDGLISSLILHCLCKYLCFASVQ